jgi:hypothetical protein
MEHFYIRLYYLKILHYFFFSLGVLSLSLSIVLYDVLMLGSQTLVLLSLFYCGASLYIASRFLKHYRKPTKTGQLIKTGLPYVLLTFYTIGMLFSFIYFFPWILQLIYSMLFVNYYIFFVLIIGILLGRFEVVGRLFIVYSDISLERAMKIVLEYSMIPNTKKYEAGADPKTDEALENVWAHKKYPLPYVREFEKEVILKRIREIDDTIPFFEKNGMKTLLENLKSERNDNIRRFEEVEKKVD